MDVLLKFIKHFTRWLFIVCLLLFISSTVIRIFASEPFVQNKLMSYANVVDSTTFTSEELLLISHSMSEYLTDDSDLLDIRITLDQRNVPLFSSKEILHMRDVKQILLKVYLLQEFTILFISVYIISIFLWAKERRLGDFFTDLFLAGSIGNLLLIFLGILLTFSFDRYFVYFHELAFSNDFWLLDPRKDALVQIYPLEFWNYIVIALITTIVIINCIMILIDRLFKKIN